MFHAIDSCVFMVMRKVGVELLRDWTQFSVIDMSLVCLLTRQSCFRLKESFLISGRMAGLIAVPLECFIYCNYNIKWLLLGTTGIGVCDRRNIYRSPRKGDESRSTRFIFSCGREPIIYLHWRVEARSVSGADRRQASLSTLKNCVTIIVS